MALERVRSRWVMHAVVGVALCTTGLTNVVGLVLARRGSDRAAARQCAENVAALLALHVAAAPEAVAGRALGLAPATWPDARYVILQGADGKVLGAAFHGGVTDIARTKTALEHARTGGSFEGAPTVVAAVRAGTGTLTAACTVNAAETRRLVGLVVLVGAIILVLALLVVEVVQRGSYRRLEAVQAAAERVSQGDLAERISDEGADEIGKVGRAVDIATARLSRIVRRIAQTAETLRRVARRINDGADKVAVGATRQVVEAQQTHEDAEGLIQALGEIAARANAVSQDSRSGADSAARLGNLSNQVAQSVQSAQSMVDETAASVTQLAQSISEVARRTTELAQSAPATSAAIARMDQSIDRVRAYAATAARDATQVASDAARGGTALRETLAGIERIHDTSAKVTEVTLALEAQIGQIDNILAVINELADRTNLLALNASIIAAQAGEHGRGFAVVATEIKDLARRTTHSIGEIGQLIDSVQGGAQAARTAVEDGARAVDAGASQARQATALLSEILERVRGSTKAAQSIADATDEQAHGSASVTSAMQQVAANVRQIAVAASEQARGAGHIRDLTESLREIVNQVGGASREQREGARLLAELTSKVTDMIEALSRLQARQSQSGERIRAATAAIRTVAHEHRDTVAGVGQAAEELGKHAELLGAEIERFKIH
ncbi:MAG: methyl-accepting chemotaxis protein [Deltaproteobacteria bacterium]|nr:methyl-accepting chemotaxis protein [Deltaproteobacteria bacterium]